MEMSLSSCRDEKGEFSFIAMIRDITARKKVEGELQEKLLELERMNKMMIDRELKMSELKQKIAVLESAAKSG
jgi:hypothetical protein